MAEFPDTDVIAREARTERMEQRIKPTVKRTIELAAAMSGTDTSDFVVTAAYREALRKIAEMSSVRLSTDDSRRLFQSLDRLEGPTEAMKELMVDYEATVENAIR